jgi:hypothetical protein
MKQTFLKAIVLLALARPAWAQPLGAGIKAGAPLTDAFRNRNIQTLLPFNLIAANSSNYIWGPYVELRLPARMSVEIDALYRKHSFNVLSSNANSIFDSTSWEFPVVLKHRLASGLIHPYFEGGLSFSRLSDIKSFSFNHLSNYGLVVGGGVEFNFLLLKVSPEVRYTGYAFRSLDTATTQSVRNQLAVLVGFGF